MYSISIFTLVERVDLNKEFEQEERKTKGFKERYSSNLPPRSVQSGRKRKKRGKVNSALQLEERRKKKKGR